MSSNVREEREEVRRVKEKMWEERGKGVIMWGEKGRSKGDKNKEKKRGEKRRKVTIGTKKW